ncbi:MAG: DNA glycosylase AlkZ-like family protein [Candidatus Longimicrobiales bacterium M2_2A_002]
MDVFSPATRHWFDTAFAAPTRVQRDGWPRIAAGEHTLLIAPTGSGKTLAAFLYALDRVGRLGAPDAPGSGSGESGPASDAPASESAGGGPEPGTPRVEPGVRVLYVSPLKALVYDIERNLRTPLAGIERAAAQLGAHYRHPRVDVRTGDTPQSDRRRQIRDPGEIMVTTPESLYLLLGGQARETFRTVQWVIVDEIHAMAGTKRGAHLSLSLERLSRVADVDPQRIGLSATARPTGEVARFLGGDRPVTVVDAHVPPLLDLEVIVPVEDMTRPVVETEDGDYAVIDGDEPAPGSLLMDAEEVETTRQYGIWPAVYPRIIELIRAHNTTLIFVNSRGLAERLAQRLNEHAGEELVRSHHGSLAHEQRRQVEEALKAGELPAIVATSSLELGIDMGALDLVILVESPGSVSSGLQRVGRAGHQVGEPSIGRVFPKHRGDLLEAAIVAQRMRDGAIEALRVPSNPLDVLAQHVVAMTAVQDWKVDELGKLVRRSANFTDLPDSAYTGVLDMLSGLYPSTEFSELRPRINWDRERNVLSGRRGARMLAAVNAGTIPDRGLFGVYLGEGGPRVGELDEEMVHESQPGNTFTLGATTWRIQDIDRDRVIVEPAPGEPGRLPFWKGEGPGRPLELGRALGAFTRAIGELAREGDGAGGRTGAVAGVAADAEDAGPAADAAGPAVARLTGEFGLDAKAAGNLVAYLREQEEATGTLPTDRDITIERFRDELGDWRICLLTPFGSRVHAPWAMAIRAAVSERVGYEVQVVWSDDGIVLTLAAGDEPPDLDVLIPDPEELDDRVVEQLTRSPLFASQFRENAARALLLPRRRPGKRMPLFAQRLRARKLMGVAMQYPGFPMVMETYRSCLQDVFDVPALKDVLRKVGSREIRLHDVETMSASPFARSLVFAYVAQFMYEGDSPAAERRAQALSVDMDMLRELLGEADLRELLDADVIGEVERQLQRLSPTRRARHADAVHDLLREVGELSRDELALRAEPGPDAGSDAEARAVVDVWLRQLEGDRRIAEVRVAGREVWIAIEDVGLYRDALGVAPPAGVASAFLEPTDDPVEQLLMRYARTHGPFTAGDVADRYGLVPAQATALLGGLAADDRLLRGEFRPDGSGVEEWVEPDVLRRIKRRTIAKLRGQVAPVDPEVLARFLPAWHRVGADRRDSIEEALIQLEGIPLAYSELVRTILPSRVRDFDPSMLDELGALGWLVWVGHSPLRSDDGRVLLYRRDRVDRLLDPPAPDQAEGRIEEYDDRHARIVEHLDARGACFHAELAAALPDVPPGRLMAAVWDLVWAGMITNDTFAALRHLGTPIRRGGRRGGNSGPGGRSAARSARRRALNPPHSSLRGGPGGGSGPGGRWSLVRDLVREPASSTERAAAWASTLLERHGVVARETLSVEALEGGFSSVYPVLRTLEEQGKVRRGYFVEGLGGAQFAYPGIVDRLRRVRDGDAEGEVIALAATDPANPFGWLVPWPELVDVAGREPTRSVGSVVVLVDGDPVLFLDRGGRRLRAFADADDEAIRTALPALRSVAATHPRRALSLEEVNGDPAFKSDLLDAMRDAGFTPDYRYVRVPSP